MKVDINPLCHFVTSPPRGDKLAFLATSLPRLALLSLRGISPKGDKLAILAISLPRLALLPLCDIYPKYQNDSSERCAYKLALLSLCDIYSKVDRRILS